jgi:hypothetical protein
VNFVLHIYNIFISESISFYSLKIHINKDTFLKSKPLFILEFIIVWLYSKTLTIKTYSLYKTTMQVDLYDCEMWRLYFSEGYAL